METNYLPNHKRRVRTYAILGRVFIPVGIVCLAIGVTLLAISVPYFVQAILAAEKSSDCVVTSSSIRCQGELGNLIALTSVGLGFGFAHVILGLPFMIAGPIFRVRAKVNRALDEANGIDYGDFPYGK